MKKKQAPDHYVVQTVNTADEVQERINTFWQDGYRLILACHTWVPPFSLGQGGMFVHVLYFERCSPVQEEKGSDDKGHSL